MHLFPPCTWPHAASTLQLDVDGCVFEIDGKQRCRNLGHEPNFVGGDGAIIGVAKAMKVDEIGCGRKAHKAGYVGLASLLKIEHSIALPITVVLDRAEQAVERTGALLYRGTANKGSSAAFAVNEPFIVQATHGVAHGVSTRFVLLNQFALGRKPGLELPTGEPTPEVFEHLGPQRHRAGAVGPPGNIYHGMTNVRTIKERCKPFDSGSLWTGLSWAKLYGHSAVRANSGEVRTWRKSMIVKQYYLGCLSQASYLIGDETTGRAVVVDPQREIAEYLTDAQMHGLAIERVIETHFHADFLSGHLELQAATGAIISYGSAAKDAVEFPIDGLEHQQVLSLGEVSLEIRHTPGHTPESISIVIREHEGDEMPYGVLTGDTLFIGDVGRPDLLTSVGVTAGELARSLYRSTREQLMTLPDATRVFPAHGAGSACGKFLSSETVSTIGEQRRTNYALQDMSEDDFVHVVTEGQSLSPLYFAFAATRNKQAHEVLTENAVPRSMSMTEVLAEQRRGAVVLDSRDPAVFAQGHLVGSYNVGLAGRYAEYAGDVLTADQPIVLVCDNGTELEAKNRLARIGFDHVVGCLGDPVSSFLSHPGWVTSASRLTVDELVDRMNHVEGLQLVDVRGPGEIAEGKMAGASEVPLARILDRLGELNPTAPTVVYCGSGYRSMVAASVMRSAGFKDVSDLVGGFSAWEQADRPIATTVASS